MSKDFLDKFKELEKQFTLIKTSEEECPLCNHKMGYYNSKYIDGIEIRFCNNCNELHINDTYNKDQNNVCPICGYIVRYEDKDNDDYIVCDDELCDKKAHETCVEDLICDNCNIWACYDHISEYIVCDYCDKIHYEDCIISFGSGFVDQFGHICESCFYKQKERNDDLIEEIKRPFKDQSPDHMIEHIEENKNFYVKEAKKNVDHSILVSHLINNSSPYEVLKEILDQKVIKASQTGYYGKKSGTKAVCFTDLTIQGLVRHSKNYSPFGIGFLKELVFEKDGGPALYIREDLIKSGNEIQDKLKPFVNKINLDSHDFHHEREWRIPNDFYFERNEISVVYAPVKYHDKIRELYSDINILIDIDLMALI